VTSFDDFLRAHLPPPPARVLDVGCGAGELTTTLAVAGWEVLGIDPAAPQGERFRRITLEEIEADERFDAVVASHSLHHVRDLDAAVDKIASLLRPDGVVVVDEHAWDLLDESTLDWFWNQRRALAAAGGGEVPATPEELRAEWDADHLGLHGFEALRSELTRGFDEVAFERVPFLYRLLGGPSSHVLETALVDAGAIQPLGLRFAGRPR
jgi:SAM-dependent methyltransferase